jgi:hypothetical protein
MEIGVTAAPLTRTTNGNFEELKDEKHIIY